MIATNHARKYASMKDTQGRHALAIVHRLHEAGYTAYFAGGAVRDRLLGREPADYDIATDAPPEVVRTLFDDTHPVGAAFGVTLVIQEGYAFEVAQFRTEGDYRDGRHPFVVAPADPEEDARRRDITINGMFYDPLDGRIIDSVGGRADLAAGIVRAIGDPVARFAEDRLRPLRAVRFAARLGFVIEPETFAAIRTAAPSVSMVASERIGAELTTLLGGAHPDRGVELLEESGLLSVLIPEVAAMRGVPQPPVFHPEGDVLTHTILMLNLFGGGSEALGWGIFLHDIGKPSTISFEDRIRFNRHDTVGAEVAERILKRLRLPGNLIDRVVYLVKNHLRPNAVPQMRRSTRRRFFAEQGVEELLELYRIDCLGSHGDLAGYEMVRMLFAEEGAAGQSPSLPKLLVNGNDLISLGYEPGPSFAVMLRAVHDAQLEGEIRDREEAIAVLRRLFPNPL